MKFFVASAVAALMISAANGQECTAKKKECSSEAVASKQECSSKASASKAKGECSSQLAAKEECSASKSACSGEGALASVNLEGCPVGAGKELVKAFEAATAQYASLTDEQKAAVAEAMEVGATCPVGKRIPGTLNYIAKAVELSDGFNQAAFGDGVEADDETKQLIEMRVAIVGAIDEVMEAHNTARKAAGACYASKSECSAQASKSECSATAAKKSECSSTAVAASKQSECSATAAKKSECSSTAVAASKQSECSATAAKKSECSSTTVAASKQECSASAAKQECSASAAKQECSASAAKQECAATAGKSEYCYKTFASKAAEMTGNGSEMAGCWSKAPEELAGLCEESKANIGEAFATMSKNDPSMNATVTTMAYLASALQKVVEIDKEIAAKMAENDCSCEYFKASCDLLAKASSVANKMMASMPKVETASS